MECHQQTREQYISSISVNNVTITNPVDISNNFNSYFASVGKKLADNLPLTNTSPTNYLSGSYPSMNNVTEVEVIDVIKALKTTGAGYDGVMINIIKHSIRALAPIITKLVNISLESGIFPDQLKIAKIRPIYKGGDKNEMPNFRPVSVLGTFSKIIERLVYNRLMDHIQQHNIIIKQQFGFRKNCSPQIAILSIVEYIYEKRPKS